MLKNKYIFPISR